MLPDDTPIHEIDRRLPPLHRAWSALAVAILAFGLFANTIPGGFVWDDRALIVESARVHQLGPDELADIFSTHFWDGSDAAGGLYRPLVRLSYHFEYRLFGHNASGYHASNALAHAITCVLIFALVVTLLNSTWFALFVAALFAAHPVHTESVAWIAGRTDIIATLWIVASLLLYARGVTKNSARWHTASLFCFFLALLSKEIALMTPLVVLAITVLKLPQETEHSKLSRWPWPAAFFAIAIVFVAMRTTVLGVRLDAYQPETSGPGTIALALAVFADYMWKLVFPFTLNAEHETAVPSGFADPMVLAGLVLVVALVAGCYRLRRHKEFVVGAVVMVVFLGPVLNLVPLTEVFAERFLYLPALGFAMLLASLVMRTLVRTRRTVPAGKKKVAEKRPARSAFSALPVLLVFGVIMVAYSARTLSRNLDWRDETTLFQKTTAVASDNERAHLNLGNAHLRAGRFTEAVAAFQRSLEVNPRYDLAWAGLARTYRSLGDLDRSLNCIDRAIEISPGKANLHNARGRTLSTAQRHAEAIESYERALDIQPDDASMQFNAGLSYYLVGRQKDAFRTFEKLEFKDTQYIHAYYYLAVIAFEQGKVSQGRRYATRFLELYGAEDDFSAHARSLLSGE